MDYKLAAAIVFMSISILTFVNIFSVTSNCVKISTYKLKKNLQPLECCFSLRLQIQITCMKLFFTNLNAQFATVTFRFAYHGHVTWNADIYTPCFPDSAASPAGVCVTVYFKQIFIFMFSLTDCVRVCVWARLPSVGIVTPGTQRDTETSQPIKHEYFHTSSCNTLSDWSFLRSVHWRYKITTLPNNTIYLCSSYITKYVYYTDK